MPAFQKTKTKTRRKTPTRALILAACLLASPLHAEIDCDDNTVCIHEERVNDEIRLLAENRSKFPVTYTMRVKTRNLSSKGPSKFTRTLPAGKSETAISLIPARAGGASRYRYYYGWTFGDQDAVHDDEHLYLLPYEAGKSYRVIQGYASSFSHTGLEQFAIDFRMDEGTPVHAARAGIVARVEERHDIGCWRDGCGRYANFIVVLHDDATTGEYYHLQKNGALVDVGDRVEAGQQIALSGNTGHTTIPHLHFAVYRAVDWGNTQSVPVRFFSADGIVDRPRRGGHYQAAGLPRPSKDPQARTRHLKLGSDE